MSQIRERAMLTIGQAYLTCISGKQQRAVFLQPLVVTGGGSK